MRQLVVDKATCACYDVNLLRPPHSRGPPPSPRRIADVGCLPHSRRPQLPNDVGRTTPPPHSHSTPHQRSAFSSSHPSLGTQLQPPVARHATPATRRSARNSTTALATGWNGNYRTARRTSAVASRSAQSSPPGTGSRLFAVAKRARPSFNKEAPRRRHTDPPTSSQRLDDSLGRRATQPAL